VVARHQDHVRLQRADPRQLAVELLDHAGLAVLVAVLARRVRPLHVQEEEVVRARPRALERRHLVGDRALRRHAGRDVHPEQPRHAEVGRVGRDRQRRQARALAQRRHRRPAREPAQQHRVRLRLPAQERVRLLEERRRDPRGLRRRGRDGRRRERRHALGCGSVSPPRPRARPAEHQREPVLEPRVDLDPHVSILGTAAFSARASGVASVAMRPARRSVSRPSAPAVAKFARAVTSPGATSIPSPSVSSTPRPTSSATGSYPKIEKCPGPLPGVIPGAIGTYRPSPPSAARASRCGCFAARGRGHPG
jgi:hypothetical protein